MTHGRWWRGAVAAAAVAGCIPEPVLRPRDAAVDARDAADVTDVSGTDAGDAAQDAGGRASARLLRPLSFSVVGTQLPELRWELPAGASGARVEVCADRDCARVEHAADAMGGLYRVTESLRAGAHFWRVRARYGTELGPPSATWEFLVQGSSSAMSVWYGFVDVDRDGVADIVVGAPQANAGRGGVLIWRGGPTPSREPTWTLAAPGPSGRGFGQALVGAGDYDGNGTADVAVVSGLSMSDSARIFLYAGERDRPAPSSSSEIQSTRSGFTSTAEVTSIGDVNGDGYADLAVSSPHALESRGEVLIFPGGAQGLSEDRFVVVRTNTTPGQRFGAGVLAPGDLDGDRIDDLLVLSHHAVRSEGRVYVVRGQRELSSSSLVPVEVQGTGEVRAWTALGDLERDAAPSFMTAAHDGPLTLLQAPAGMDAGRTIHSITTMSASCPKFGAGFAGGFDFDRDDRPDLLFHCVQDSQTTNVQIVSGLGRSITQYTGLTLTTEASQRSFGYAFRSYGDVTADGVADLIVATAVGDEFPPTLQVLQRSVDGAMSAPIRLEGPVGAPLTGGLVLSR